MKLQHKDFEFWVIAGKKTFFDETDMAQKKKAGQEARFQF